ncbi:MAG TPA: family 43 glycosylhydrolase [Verrucomicrobiae bacterium]|jgi:arabinan endo-1,5-alpha-L-arabinosidase
MKKFFASVFCAFLFFAANFSAYALDGFIGIHDPSTVIKCDGNYYVFGTGRGMPFLVSSNGFDWERGGHVFDQVPEDVRQYAPSNNGIGVWAPDIIHVGGQYYLYYAISSWGVFVSAVGLMTSPTLDPKSADYKWTDCGMVVHSSAGEALNAIDPGVCYAPDGTLWLCYGSYHGNIELVELDPKTGQRIATNSPVTIIASDSEASDIIHHGNYFYLFVNHGSCCQGSNSTYNIRVGRSEKITGPYINRYGDDLVGGGGTLFVSAQGNDIGPGHFGLLLDDGVEKFSCHYEAEIGRVGRSILDIRPLLWTVDDWPQPGENLREGVYQIRSLRTGMILQNSPGTNAAPLQTGRYLSRDHQKWNISPVGHGFYKIFNAKNGDALTADNTAVNLVPFTSAENQLWKLDQLSDGSYRVKSIAGDLALATGERNGIELGAFTGDDLQHWQILAP